MLVHLCFAFFVGDGLDEAAAMAAAWAAPVEPDDRVVDACEADVCALVWVPLVAAPAAVRPPARTPAAIAVPTSGRRIRTQFSLA